jgi:membrane protein
MGAGAPTRSRTQREGMLACLAAEARAFSARAATREILRGFKENDLLTYASAISFQVFFALVPLALVGLGLLGSLGLEDVWTSDLAPDVRANVSPEAYQVIDETVTKILSERQLFWVTLGALIAIWEVSGAMRATMQVLSRVYHVEERRSFGRKLFESIALSSVVALMLLVAAAVTVGGPPLLESAFGDGRAASVLSSLASWALAVALLFLVVTLVVRFAPDTRRPVRWVTFGGVIVIAGWIAMSLVYGVYISSLADYDSIFGSLALVMVTLSYIYLSAIVFLTGAQLDSLIRRQVEA